MTQAKFPKKLRFLFEPMRYKVAHGGRGSAKSWSFARALLIQSAQRPLRILCTREVQKSIRDSVHKLLSDQIQALGLGQFYEIQRDIIKGANGSEFIFAGLSDQTAESVKSFEGVDIVWVEEAQAVSDRSWNILTPTIRKRGSEIWVSFNPDLDTDPTWVRFVENTPANAVVVEVNYCDNPWFGETELEDERAHDEATLPKVEYENKWLGKCKPAATGAIYADEVAAAMAASPSRVCELPYDPALKVHAIFDLGWNDKMSIILVQRHVSQLRCIRYIEDSHKTLDWYSAEMKKLGWNWGTIWLPHDGKHGDYKTGKSAEQIMRELGWDVRITPSQSIEGGIKVARRGFPQTYFDKEGTKGLVECLKRYRRATPMTTGEPGAPIHDQYSHGADAFRYLHLAAPSLSNEQWGELKLPDLGIV